MPVPHVSYCQGTPPKLNMWGSERSFTRHHYDQSTMRAYPPAGRAVGFGTKEVRATLDTTEYQRTVVGHECVGTGSNTWQAVQPIARHNPRRRAHVHPS